MKKIVLIDGNSLINRAFYATPPLTDKSNNPTNAIYGFINMLIKIIGDIDPKYLAVAFDMRAPTFRHEIYSEYKGTRKPMPEDLAKQLPILKEILTLMNIKRIEIPTIEADDIIGTIATKFDTQTIIITGDKDSFQLVNETTEVYFTKRGISDLEKLDYTNFKEIVKINPNQIIELKALMGDASDNIPGVKGIGEKTAFTLLETYDNIDSIYENLDKFTGKLKEKLENGKDMAYLSKKLATINTDVKFDLSLEDMVFHFPFDKAVKEKFAELDFNNFIKRADIFERDGEKIDIKQDQSILKINDISDIATMKQVLEKTTKISIVLDKYIYFSSGKEEFRVKIKEGFLDDGIDFGEVLQALKPIISNEKIEKIVFNKKNLQHILDDFDIEFKGQTRDVSILNYLVNYSGKEDSLKDVLSSMNMNIDALATSLYLLNDKFLEELKNNDMEYLYNDIELPLSDVLFDMEKSGFKIDEEILNNLSEKYQLQLKDISEKIYILANNRFNLNSPKQLAVVLFEDLGLKTGKKNKTGYSTNADVLEKLIDKHEIIPLILKYRQLQKIQSTYIEGFRPLIDKKTGLIHTSFNQLVTSTGRLSSKEPNLQNIPVREDEGRELRKFFVPRDNEHILVSADYSQIELRLLAHFSKDEKLVKAYLNSEDIHKLTASEVFNVKLEDVTSLQRRNAKAVNFGIIYGISMYGLAQNINISTKMANDYINKYFQTYSKVKEYMNSNVEFARQNGYVSTLLGRKRYIREINSSNFNTRSFGERAAMNMPLQGSSADIIKIAMVRVFKRLKAENLQSKLILQVHDELIIDALKTEAEQVKKILKEEMENAYKLEVPLTVEVVSGKDWFSAK